MKCFTFINRGGNLGQYEYEIQIESSELQPSIQTELTQILKHKNVWGYSPSTPIEIIFHDVI